MNVIDIILLGIILSLFILACVKIYRKIVCARNGNGCAGCIIASSCSKNTHKNSNLK